MRSANISRIQGDTQVTMAIKNRQAGMDSLAEKQISIGWWAMTVDVC